jgi:hypothetical protein
MKKIGFSASGKGAGHPADAALTARFPAQVLGPRPMIEGEAVTNTFCGDDVFVALPHKRKVDGNIA